MPVISPIKTDASTKHNVTAEALSAKQDAESTEKKSAEKTTSVPAQNAEKTNAASTAKRMVQKADQWRNCSRPHRI